VAAADLTTLSLTITLPPAPSPVKDTALAVQVNQVGYVPGQPVLAKVVTLSADPLNWAVKGHRGEGGDQTTDVAEGGKTTLHGFDTINGNRSLMKPPGLVSLSLTRERGQDAAPENVVLAYDTAPED
jgi:hypothetical protein